MLFKINPSFTKKNQLKLDLSKNILGRNYKLCFSLVYSIKSIEGAEILKQIGIRSIWRKNSLYIKGTNKVIKTKKVVKIPDLKDHRIAMSGSILSLATGVKVETKGFETVNTSSPNFLKILSTLGGKFEIKKK